MGGRRWDMVRVGWCGVTLRGIEAFLGLGPAVQLFSAVRMFEEGIGSLSLLRLGCFDKLEFGDGLFVRSKLINNC